MPAEPAAAPDASGATESIQSAEHPHVEEQLTGARPAIGERAQALLDEMEVPRDVQESLQPKTERPNAKQTETESQDAQAAGDPKSPERSDGGQPGDQAEKDKENVQRSTSNVQRPTEDKDEEPPLTQEQQREAPPWVMPRIHKITAQRESEKKARLEAERIAVEQNTLARQLHAQLQDTSRVRPAPTQNDPLADVFTAQDLRTAVDEHEELLEWATTNPDGLQGVVIGKDADGNPVTRDYTAQEMAKIAAKSGRILRQVVPAKAAFLHQQQQHEQYARAALPQMFQEGTEENAAYQQLIENVPEIAARLPGYQQWIAWAIKGRAAAMAELKASGAANGSGTGKAKAIVDPKVAPFLQNHPPMAPGVPITGGNRSLERPTKDSARKEAVEKFTAEGADDDALENLVERTRRMQAQPQESALV